VRPTDWILLATCGVLLVSGPAMALQEFIRGEESAGLELVTGEVQPLDPAFRAGWRLVILILVVVGGLAGTLIAFRVAAQPKVRAVSARVLTLLLVGMTLLDLAFLADGRWFLDASYAIRAVSIVWVYPIAGILMGGALMRITELEAAFGNAAAAQAQSSGSR